MSTTQEIHELIRMAFDIEPGIKLRGHDELAVHCHGEGARILLAENLRRKYGINVMSADIKRCHTVDAVENMVIGKEAEKERTNPGSRPGIGSYLSMGNYS